MTQPEPTPAEIHAQVAADAAIKAAQAASAQPADSPTAENGAETAAPVEATELEVASQTIQELAGKLKEAQDQFLRAKAETDNMRRRAQEDIAKAHKFGIENFAESMLPVKDSLERALAIEQVTLDAYKEGMEITLKQLSGAFEKNRLVEITAAVGEKFNPAQHQAVAMVPKENPAQEPNTIMVCMQKGYLIADRVLRPALVTVVAA